MTFALCAMSAANGQTTASNEESKISCEALAAARGVYEPLMDAQAGQADAFGNLQAVSRVSVVDCKLYQIQARTFVNLLSVWRET